MFEVLQLSVAIVVIRFDLMYSGSEFESRQVHHKPFLLASQHPTGVPSSLGKQELTVHGKFRWVCTGPALVSTGYRRRETQHGKAEAA